MNWSKEIFSCSVHEVVRGANERINTREKPRIGMANLLALLLHIGFMSSLVTLWGVFLAMVGTWEQ
jgi:hypothetical protein